MSKKKADTDMVLNKLGKEKPIQKGVRLFRKQSIKVKKNSKIGDHSKYIRNAIDAYEGK